MSSYLHADQPDGNGPLNVTPEREALIERLAAESRAKQQDRFEMPALVEGENAYRVAEFEVSLELLKSVLQMPAESLIIGVRPGDTPYRATLVVKVADPSLPSVLFIAPDAQPDGHKGAGEVELERGSELAPQPDRVRGVW